MRGFSVFTMKMKTRPWRHISHDIEIPSTEKYITFSVPIKKKIDNKNIDITYKIKFIDSFRFMATSLSKLVDNLTGNIHNDKCIKYKSNICFVRVMNETLLFKCIDCDKE